MLSKSEQKRIYSLWESYILGKSIDTSFLRPITIQAWDRCRSSGIDPKNLNYEFLSDEKLTDLQRMNVDLIATATPYIEHISASLTDKPHIIALSDADGWILKMVGDVEFFGGQSAAIVEGASWNEKTFSNNGIGTALVLGEPVLIYGVEHYGQPCHGYTGLGVPIRQRGEVIGCLDVSVFNEDESPERFNLVQACVASIESHLDQLASVHDKVERIERFTALSGLMATAIHDLKNPLTYIRATSQLGMMTTTDEREKKSYDRIITQTDRLTKMLGQLLAISISEEPSPCSPVELLFNLIIDIEPHCTTQNIHLVHDISGDVTICLQREMFTRAVNNILINALKVMPNGGTLSVRSYFLESRFRIEVADTGDGIPEEVQKTIFQPFSTSTTGGSGLGLYMVYQTVTHHQGRVWFNTKQGEGTTFFIEIPVS